MIKKSDSVFKMIFGQKCSALTLEDVSPIPCLGLYFLVVVNGIPESDL